MTPTEVTDSAQQSAQQDESAVAAATLLPRKSLGAISRRGSASSGWKKSSRTQGKPHRALVLAARTVNFPLSENLVPDNSFVSFRLFRG